MMCGDLVRLAYVSPFAFCEDAPCKTPERVFRLQPNQASTNAFAAEKAKRLEDVCFTKVVPSSFETLWWALLKRDTSFYEKKHTFFSGFVYFDMYGLEISTLPSMDHCFLPFFHWWLIMVNPFCCHPFRGQMICGSTFQGIPFALKTRRKTKPPQETGPSSASLFVGAAWGQPRWCELGASSCGKVSFAVCFERLLLKAFRLFAFLLFVCFLVD